MIYTHLAFVLLVYFLIFFIFLKKDKQAIKKGLDKEALVASTTSVTKSTKVQPKKSYFNICIK